MIRASLLFAVVVVVIVIFAVVPAHADRRSFGYTYEYQTMPEGGLDLEIWGTQVRPDLGEAATGYEFRLEVEYGITDHWDIAFYQVFAQGAAETDPFAFDATKIETRYRFAERGEWPIDVLGYFEVVKPLREDAVELEFKAILARDVGPVTFALNLIGEIVLASDVHFVPGWSFGATWEVVPAFHIGAETFGERNEDDTIHAWAGPALSWAPSPKLWVTGFVGFGLTNNSEDFLGRLILGISI
jgi:hypothetical protein